MLRRVEIKGYRALSYVNVNLSEFQVMVGPNGSGKSTFFDAIKLLRDILNVGLERSIQGDHRFDVPMRAVDPLDLSWMRSDASIEIALMAELPEKIRKSLSNGYSYCRYEITLKVAPELRLENETFWLCHSLPSERKDSFLFPMPAAVPDRVCRPPGAQTPGGWRKVLSKKADTGNDYFRAETSDWNTLFRLGPSKATLANLPDDEKKFPAATWFKGYLMEGVERLVLNAELMRSPCLPGPSRAFRMDGSNLPLVVNALQEKDASRYAEWLDHIRTVLPDVESITTSERPENRARYLIVRFNTGLEAPSWALSEGTLRLIALSLIAYAPDTPQAILVEEPENGIHPQAIEAVFQSLSSVYGRQVFLATHSPVILRCAKPHQLLCFRKAENGAVAVARGDAHHKLKDWQHGIDLGDLFAAGVLS